MKAQRDSGNHPRTHGGTLECDGTFGADTGRCQKPARLPPPAGALHGNLEAERQHQGLGEGWGVRQGGKSTVLPERNNAIRATQPKRQDGRGGSHSLPTPGTHSSPTHHVPQAVAMWGWAGGPPPLRRNVSVCSRPHPSHVRSESNQVLTRILLMTLSSESYISYKTTSKISIPRNNILPL